jgi:hypothetical protein
MMPPQINAFAPDFEAPKSQLEWRYQIYFATKVGRGGYEQHRQAFAKLIWRTGFTKLEAPPAFARAVIDVSHQG